MKYFLMLVVVLFTTACSVDGWEINTAQTYCKDRGGVDSMVVNITKPTRVYCNDGTATQLPNPQRG